MPPLPPVTSPACVRVEWRTGDQATIEAGSRVYFSYTGSAPSTADLNSLATAVSTAWGAHIGTQLTSNESLHGVIVTDLSSDTGAIGEWTGTIDGTGSGDNLQASIATLINHQITRRYRGGRPRTYVRMGQEIDLEGTNEWTDDYLAAALTVWEAFVAQVLATTGIGISLSDIVNISYYKGFTPVLNPITGRTRDVPTIRDTPLVDPIVLSVVAKKLGSQRRRLDIG